MARSAHNVAMLGGSHTHNWMREVLALLGVAFYIVACIVLVSMSGRWDWFVAAVGVLLLGRALGHLAISPHLTRSRRWLGLSFWRADQLKVLAYVMAGTFAMIGALFSLDRPFGFIVAFGAFCWVWFWGSILAQFRLWKESCPPAPPDRVA